MRLTALIALPLLGALVTALLPRAEERQHRHVGMLFALATFLLSLGVLAAFDPTEGGFQLSLNVTWIAALGVGFHLGVDGISLWLVLLTTFLTPLVILSTYGSVSQRPKELVVSLLLLEVGMLGAFLSLDLFLFYVFWELMLVPMALIIGIWGHEGRTHAAIKFVLYTVLGSLLMLVAIIYLYITHGRATGEYTFDYLVLVQCVWGERAQLWLFAAFALAFAIKVPMFPLHTWLPDAHVEAPTAGSVILAGVLLKLGTYGFLRFAIPMFPWAAAAFAPYLSALAVVGIVYGALVAYAQKDAKKLVAYSSVSHLGFVMLGILAMTASGVQGGLFLMISHGLTTGGLFLALGALYDRRHTRLLSQFGGLWKRLPVLGGLFLVILLGSAGLPGLSGFVGELLVLAASFTHGQDAATAGLPQLLWHPRLLTALAATGIVLGAVYLLHLFQKLMLGSITHPLNQELPDLSRKERWTLIPLVALILLLGVYPRPILVSMQPSVDRFLQDYKVKLAASEGYNAPLPRRLPAKAPLLPATRPAGSDKNAPQARAKAAPERSL